MSYASLDVGSNSIRLLVGNVIGGRVVPFVYERVTTRLASGLSSGTGALGDEQMHRTLSALAGFRSIVDAQGVRSIKAAGTSALRSASNSREFLGRALAETGFEISVITGEEEARLTALGVLSSLEGRLDPAVILDIGGGSTELVLVNQGKIELARTEPLGAVSLIERHIRSDPPAMTEIVSLEAECASASSRFREAFAPLIKARKVPMIGTAGTMTTLASMDMALDRYERDMVNGHSIELGRLRALHDKISLMKLSDRRTLRGLEPDRADLIIAGLTLTINIMDYLDFNSLRISDAGLLEGLLIDLVREVGNKHHK